jgi:lipid A ethanolaminephosphotransferase
MKKKTNITIISLVLSVFTLVAYHYPALRLVFENVEGVNSLLLGCGCAVVLLAGNFFVYYLLLYAGRIVGKCILAFTFIANAITFYFIDVYDVLMTEKMMGNVFNTRFSEASAYFSMTAVWYFLLLGVVPCIYLFVRKVDYGTIRRFFVNIGIALGVVALVVLGNMRNVLWIDRNSTELGSLLMPWSYVVNTVRYYNQERQKNRKEILLPDAHIATTDKEVCVLVIGESARQQNFSLYGYERDTNPLLRQDSVVALRAEASATYTTAGVKAILDHKPTNDLYEILPNYLSRSGVEVIWRTANWGEPPLNVDSYLDKKSLAELYPEADERYDGILFEGLSEQIRHSTADKLFIVLHLSTSHGPTYSQKYPAEFEQFTPVCTTVEMSEADHSELINAYDNTILYTDYLLHTLIGELSAIEERRAAILFISDHGESLGENGLYMHGMPMAVAPAEQTAIPFIVWENAADIKTDDLEEAGHYHIFHSVLNFFGLESEIYDAEMSVFRSEQANNN